MARAEYVTYYRLSSANEELSRRDLNAQRKTVEAYLNGGQGKSVGEFIEIERGRKPARPKLTEAIAAAQLFQVPLIVAKLHRLSRNAAFLATLRDSGVKVVFADMPDAHDLTMRILASVAEWETKAIGSEIKGALAAAEARGQKLGRKRRDRREKSQIPGAETAAQMVRNRERALKLAPALAEIRAAGDMSLTALARRLSAKGIPTVTGTTRWTASQVSRVRALIAEGKLPQPTPLDGG
jgi:DNA invertase Pin-like site-specific DNA recombinase